MHSAFSPPLVPQSREQIVHMPFSASKFAFSARSVLISSLMVPLYPQFWLLVDTFLTCWPSLKFPRWNRLRFTLSSSICFTHCIFFYSLEMPRGVFHVTLNFYFVQGHKDKTKHNDTGFYQQLFRHILSKICWVSLSTFLRGPPASLFHHTALNLSDKYILIYIKNI